MSKKLKLFVWEGVLTDYTKGIMFALAFSVDEARNVIMEKEGNGTFDNPTYEDPVYDGLCGEPKVFESATGYVVWGGA